MNAGQRAAARALLAPEGQQGKRTDLSTKSGEVASKYEINLVSRARFVLRHDRALLMSVINGAESLNAAYEQAKAIRDEQASKEDAEASKKSVPRLAHIAPTRAGRNLGR